jgi:hypothetical protein
MSKASLRPTSSKTDALNRQLFSTRMNFARLSFGEDPFADSAVAVAVVIMVMVMVMVVIVVMIVVVMMMSVTIVLGGAGVLVLDVAVIGGADRKRLAALKVDELGLGIV